MSASGMAAKYMYKPLLCTFDVSPYQASVTLVKVWNDSYNFRPSKELELLTPWTKLSDSKKYGTNSTKYWKWYEKKALQWPISSLSLKFKVTPNKG